jgi:hypothetical protein
MAPQQGDCVGQFVIYRDYWRIGPFSGQQWGNFPRHDARSHDCDYTVIQLKSFFEGIRFIREDVAPDDGLDLFSAAPIPTETNDSNIQVFGEYKYDLLSCGELSSPPMSMIADRAIPASRTLRAISETVPLIVTWSSQDA